MKTITPNAEAFNADARVIRLDLREVLGMIAMHERLAIVIENGTVDCDGNPIGTRIIPVRMLEIVNALLENMLGDFSEGPDGLFINQQHNQYEK